MFIPNRAPDRLRYFLATPFALVGDILTYLSLYIMGRNNAAWTVLRSAQSMGAEIMSVEEFEEMKRKYSEQEDKD